MKVAITLNEVVRDFSSNFSDIYARIEKSNEEEYSAYEHIVDDEWVKTDIKSEKRKSILIDQKNDPFSLSNIHHFESLETFEDILYNQYSFEIFGTTNPIYPSAMIDLNKLYQSITKKHSCTILSQEKNNSKHSTLHFLSVNRCMVNNIKFLENYSKVWQLYDVIITANPYILKRKNLNNKKKMSIKINTKVNENIKADYAFDTLNDFLNYYK